MKILVLAYIGLPSNDIGLRTADAFTRLGHQVMVLPFDEDLPLVERVGYFFAHPMTYRSFNRRLMKCARSFGPDLVCIVGSNWGVWPDSLRQLKAMGIRLVLWDFSLRIWKGFQVECLTFYDAYFVIDSYMVPILRNIARLQRVEWLPACADPASLRPMKLSEDECVRYGADVAFIGTGYDNRVQLFQTVSGFRFRVWGKEWPEIGPHVTVETEPVYGLKKNKIYSASAINLNLQGLDFQVSGVSERVFEIGACQGCVLTSVYQDVPKLFRVGEEIALFSDSRELSVKIAHLLSHEDERLEMGRRARTRIIKEHTYVHRVERILDAAAIAA